jgi:hypothetical protein
MTDTYPDGEEMFVRHLLWHGWIQRYAGDGVRLCVGYGDEVGWWCWFETEDDYAEEEHDA